MLKKTPLSGKNVEVTFRMPPLPGVVELFLCGEFNNWRTSGAPLTQEADGSWEATLVLEGGRSYRFRYYDNQGLWYTDWEADAHVPNEFGSEDSVLDLTTLGKHLRHEAVQIPPKKKQVTKKTAAKRRALDSPSEPHRGNPAVERKSARADDALCGRLARALP